MRFKYKQIGNGLGFGGNLLENILKSRGIVSPIEFLNVGEHNIEDFHLYDGMNEAVLCIDKHIKNNNKIVIVKDEDLDGITSMTLIYQYIFKINPNANVEYIMHDRKAHGLTKDILLQIKKGQYDLVLLPDAGTNDILECKVLKDNNIDVIILDHHKQTEKLVDIGDGTSLNYNPFAIVVNNQLSPKIKNKTMTGVGVCYKFAKALDEYYNVNYADDFLDLVAIGMIADSCDLSNLESRHLVLKGINLMEKKENKNVFISKLIEKQSYSMKNKVTITGIAFYISPLVNSVIRSGTYEDNMDLLKAFIGIKEIKKTKIRGKGEVELNIQDYAVRLCESCKRKQTKIVNNSVSVLDKQIEEYQLNNMAMLVLNGIDIESNYTGLIANKIANKYQKPCLLMKSHKNQFEGSGRGYDKSEINNLRQWCLNTNLFNLAEGHDEAFGIAISPKNVNKLYEIIKKLPTTNSLTYYVDAILNDKTINKSLIELIAKYDDIWGNGIHQPIFAIENIIIESENINLIGGKKNTIKFIYKGIEFMKFNTNEDEFNLINNNEQNKFTIIGRFSLNKYKGANIPQIMIEDWDFRKCEEIKKFVF